MAFYTLCLVLKKIKHYKLYILGIYKIYLGNISIIRQTKG